MENFTTGQFILMLYIRNIRERRKRIVHRDNMMDQNVLYEGFTCNKKYLKGHALSNGNLLHILCSVGCTYCFPKRNYSYIRHKGIL